MIKDVPEDKIDLDTRLMQAAGKTVKGIALEAAGLPEDTDLSGFKVAVVPITSGLGIISGFSASVDAIVKRLGMDSHVTQGTDVNGFTEAVREGADIIMMADDNMFIAYNVREMRETDNSWGTAKGYAVALKNAAGGLEGKKVLVIGAGMVGSWAVRFLKDMGADVYVTDIIYEKAERLLEDLRQYGAKPLRDVNEAISENTLLLNAAPFIIPGEIIAEGSIFSSPGVPHYYDQVGRSRAKAIIHDPLEIGAAVMAVNSAGYSIKKE